MQEAGACMNMQFKLEPALMSKSLIAWSVAKCLDDRLALRALCKSSLRFFYPWRAASCQWCPCGFMLKPG